MLSTGLKSYDAERDMQWDYACYFSLSCQNMRLQSVTQCVLLGAKNVLSLVTSSQGQAGTKLLLNCMHMSG